MPGLFFRIPERHRFWAPLVCGTILYFFANIQRVAIPGSIFDLLQGELGRSAPCITALGSAFMYTYAFCQLGIGLLVDRYGGHRVIALGALLFCLGSLLFPLARDLPLLYLARALTGLGASSLYLSLVKETMRAFNRNFTIMLSMVILIGYAGGVVAGAPFVAWVSLLGWRGAMLVIAVLSAGFYALFLLAQAGVRKPPVHPVPFSPGPLRTILAGRNNRRLFLFCGLNFGLYYVLQTVLGKKFLEDFCRLSSQQAAWMLSLMGVLAAVSGLGFAVASRLLDNRRRIFIRVAGAGCLLAFLAINTLLALGIRTTWMAALLGLLCLTASTTAIVVPLLRETNARELGGVAASLLNFGCYLTVALLGHLVGLLMNLFPPLPVDGILRYGVASYRAVFGFMLALAALAAWCAFQVREPDGPPRTPAS